MAGSVPREPSSAWEESLIGLTMPRIEHSSADQVDGAAASAREVPSFQAPGAADEDPRLPMVDEITQVVPVRELEEALARRGLFARLEAVSLAELVQLGGQRPGRAAYRVTSGELVGHLHFDSGQLYAAELESRETGALTGLDALAHMLRLETGAFASCERPWPRQGNVDLDVVGALLRVTSRPPPPRGPRRSSPGAAPAPPSAGALPPPRFVVRTVDSMRVDDEAPPSERHDPLLGALALDVYEHARRFGDLLGLARLASARLIDDLWIFLLFHESNPDCISAVLGTKGKIGESAADLRADAARAAVVHSASSSPRSLDELSADSGFIAGFVAGAQGELRASRCFSGHAESSIAVAARLSAALLRCSDPAGFAAATAELRFAGGRVVLRQSGQTVIGLIAVGTAPWPWLRQVARELCTSKV